MASDKSVWPAYSVRLVRGLRVVPWLGGRGRAGPPADTDSRSCFPAVRRAPSALPLCTQALRCIPVNSLVWPPLPNWTLWPGCKAAAPPCWVSLHSLNPDTDHPQAASPLDTAVMGQGPSWERRSDTGGVGARASQGYSPEDWGPTQGSGGSSVSQPQVPRTGGEVAITGHWVCWAQWTPQVGISSRWLEIWVWCSGEGQRPLAHGWGGVWVTYTEDQDREGGL